MTSWDWQTTASVADTVTAVSAVAGVITATVLGLKAVRIARGDNTRGAQEFLYNQVSAVLDAGLSLVAASAALRSHGADGASAKLHIDWAATAYAGRLRVMRELTPGEGETDEFATCREFAEVLKVVAQAGQELRIHGRSVLFSTIFDSGSDGNSILEELASAEHSHTGPMNPHAQEQEPSDGMGVSRVFGNSDGVVGDLRAKVLRSDARFTSNESLRLVVPWIYEALGWLEVQAAMEDGTPLMVVEPNPIIGYDPTTGAAEFAPHPHPTAREWFKSWPTRHYWSMEDHGNDPDDPQSVFVSPEDLVDTLTADLEAKLLDLTAALAGTLRSQANSGTTP